MSAEASPITSRERLEDDNPEVKLRPQSLDDFTGQRAAC